MNKVRSLMCKGAESIFLGLTFYDHLQNNQTTFLSLDPVRHVFNH